MTAPFIDLQATHNPHRWFLPLNARLCVGPPASRFMFGGVGLAAAIGAMERTCGRKVVWATAQYLSYARPSDIVDLDVWVPAQGKHVSQARVIAHVGDKEILTVNAALGERPGAPEHQWARRPDAPAPDDCPASDRWRDQDDGLHGQLDVRVASGGSRAGGRPSDDGRTVLWIRPRAGQAIDASMLAIMADHVPAGVGAALGRNAGGNSLDNTIRYMRPAPTTWVLAEIAIIGAAGGFAHGAIRLFSDSGHLLATASQSMILRLRDETLAHGN